MSQKIVGHAKKIRHAKGGSRHEIFKGLKPEEQGFTLLKLPQRLQKELLSKIENKDLLGILHFLDPDEITDILQNVSKHRREKILGKLKRELKEKVEFLLKFYPKSAAGMMSLDYVEVEMDTPIKEVSDRIGKHVKGTGKEPVVLAVDEGKLIGEVQIYKLLLPNIKKVKDTVAKVPTVRYDADQEKCIEKFKHHPNEMVIVLNQDKSIMGVIYAHDLLEVMEKEATDDLYGFAAVHAEEDVLDSYKLKVKHRYKWLLINLITAFLAAAVIGMFQGTISKLVLLVVYLPVVAGMGGNTGIQTLAVVVRGLALKEVDLAHGKKVIINEAIAGTINGAIIGVLVAGIAGAMNQSPLLGLVLFIAMVINMLIAGIFGAAIPLILQKLGQDPADAASIFITTATDVCGYLVFLGLATMLLF